MKNSNQRLRFLNIYRMKLRNELDQMKAGPLSQMATQDTSDAPDHVTSAIVVAATALMFASIFLVQ